MQTVGDPRGRSASAFPLLSEHLPPPAHWRDVPAPCRDVRPLDWNPCLAGGKLYQSIERITPFLRWLLPPRCFQQPLLLRRQTLRPVSRALLPFLFRFEMGMATSSVGRWYSWSRFPRAAHPHHHYPVLRRLPSIQRKSLRLIARCDLPRSLSRTLRRRRYPTRCLRLSNLCIRRTVLQSTRVYTRESNNFMGCIRVYTIHKPEYHLFGGRTIRSVLSVQYL